MTVRQPRYSKEEFARRGDAIYESQVRPQVEAGNRGKIVAIDIETGAFENVLPTAHLGAQPTSLVKHQNHLLVLANLHCHRKVGQHAAKELSIGSRQNPPVGLP